MEIYIHRQAQDTVFADVAPSTTAGALAAEQVGAGAHVWLEDEEEPVDPKATVAKAGVKDRSHVHISKCKKISVSVRYGGDPVKKKFSPAATVAAVFDWATGDDGFPLTATEKAKHTLGVCDTNTEADRAEHVGTFADDRCAVCFDLAPKERFEG